MRAYPVLRDAVEGGALYGVRRFYKHRDDVPPEEEIGALADEVAQHVINAICEAFDFDDGCP